MSLNKTPNPPPPGKPTEPWRVERMVQRVPGHLGEESRFSPWLVVAAIAVIIIIGVVLLLVLQFPSSEPAPAAAPVTAAPTRRVTVIKITATPEATSTATPVPTQVVVKYTVKKGDTLSTIARQFKTTVEAIRAANNLPDDTIHVGDVLNIPQGTPGAIADVIVTPVAGGDCRATDQYPIGLSDADADSATDCGKYNCNNPHSDAGGCHLCGEIRRYAQLDCRDL